MPLGELVTSENRGVARAARAAALIETLDRLVALHAATGHSDAADAWKRKLNSFIAPE